MSGGLVPDKEDFELLSKMPWRKLVVSNGIAGLLGAVVLVYYFHSVINPKFDAIDRKMDELILHLIPSPKTALFVPGSAEQRVKSVQGSSGLIPIQSAYGSDRR